MELSGLSNEVLRLLLAQNNLLITGSREQLIERLGSISPSNPSATRTRNSDASASAAKRPRTNRQEPGSSDVPDEPRNPTPEDELPGDTPTEPNDNNPEDIQDGGRNEAPPANSAFDPANLATLIGNIVDQKLKNFRPAVQSASSLPTALPTSSSTPQLATTRQLGDPTFVASLLSQPSPSTSADLHLPSATPSSSLADHVPTKTKQAVLRGEYVEFDLLLPENSSLVTDNELTRLSISVGGKQVELPNPRRKKTHVDSIDKWLSAFAVYCTILLTSFPRRAVEMFAYQEIIRSAQRKFAGFAWLSYDIDFRRKAAGNLSLNWGERDTQLYLMKFTGQAKSCCSICGSGDHYSYGCSLSALRPNNTQRGLCNNYNRGTKCSQDPCPFSHRCKTCYGDHPAFRHDDPPSKPRSQTDKKSSNR